MAANRQLEVRKGARKANEIPFLPETLVVLPRASWMPPDAGLLFGRLLTAHCQEGITSRIFS
jgi:hypothetical protein